jgi:2-polyprenyl-3-methyl-5-hydroxy-6-metoxy-1,4-benzoquinol methylase
MLKQILKKINNKKYVVPIERLDTSTDDENYDKEIKKVMNLLSYTRKSGVSYSGGKFNTGYHSFNLKGYEFIGQRNPKLRFRNLPFSLKGLSVLDIGCNQGGMLHAFSDEIAFGVGIDYDGRMINVANKIKSYTKTENLDFYIFNLESENLEYITDFIPTKKVDVILLLSICMWIENWKEVIKFAHDNSEKLIFESNGKPEQQKEQIEFLKNTFQKVDLINEKSDDDPSQKNRKLFVCYD